MKRLAKLGDTIRIGIDRPYYTGQVYFDQDGRIYDENGELFCSTQYRYVTLDTPEAVQYFNRTGKVLPDA